MRYGLLLPARRAWNIWFDTHSVYYPFDGDLLPLSNLETSAPGAVADAESERAPYVNRPDRERAVGGEAARPRPPWRAARRGGGGNEAASALLDHDAIFTRPPVSAVRLRGAPTWRTGRLDCLERVRAGGGAGRPAPRELWFRTGPSVESAAFDDARPRLPPRTVRDHRPARRGRDGGRLPGDRLEAEARGRDQGPPRGVRRATPSASPGSSARRRSWPSSSTRTSPRSTASRSRTASAPSSWSSSRARTSPSG